MATGNFTKGDLFVANDDNTVARLPGGATTHPLFGGGAGQLPGYRAIQAADLPSLSSTYQPLSSVLTAMAGGGMSVFPRNVHVNVTPVLSTATTAEEDLMSYVLPGGTLATDKDVVEIEAWGAPSANVIDKRVRLYFGATVIFDSGMEPFTTGSFQIRARVYRTGAATQVAVATWTGQVDVMTSPPHVTQRTSPNATLASDVTIKMTSTVDVGAAAGDLRQSGLDVSVRRAA